MSLVDDTSFPLRLLKAHDYALIDQFVIGDALQDIIGIAPDLVPIVPQSMEADADKFPLLLPLSNLDNDALQTLFSLLEHAHLEHAALPIVCLFKCAAGVDSLRNQWMRRMIVQTTRGQKFQLRSYVPSVFVQLQRIYNSGQLKALFDEIEIWSIYQDHSWQSLRSPDTSPTRYNLIDEIQLAQLMRVQAINRTLATFDTQKEGGNSNDLSSLTTSRPLYSSSNTTDFFAFSTAIDALILRAQRHGLVREDDQVQFTLHGLTQHPQFDSHPRIQKIIAEMDREEQTYTDVAALLQPEDWQRICNELKAPAFSEA